MRTTLALLLLVALAAPAHADARSRRLTIAGAVLAAVGGAAVVGGLSSLAYGVANPPTVPASCYAASDLPHPCPRLPNDPLAGGAATLGVGAAVLGTGIALVVVGKRGERKLTVASNGLVLRF